MSALLRLHTSEAISNLAQSKQEDISSKVTDAVDFLRKTEKLNQEDMDNFSNASNGTGLMPDWEIAAHTKPQSHYMEGFTEICFTYLVYIGS